MSETRRSVSEPQPSVRFDTEWSSARVVVAAVVTSIAYLLGCKLGVALKLQSEAVSVLWPPNALLLAALLLSPVRAWGFLLLAVLPPHLAVELKAGVPLTMALCWYVSNCLEALIGAAIFRAWVARHGETQSVRAFGVFMLGATFFATFVSTFADAGFVTLLGWRGGTFWHVWQERFFSNMLATQTIVPAVMATASTDWRSARKAPFARYAEAGVLGGLLLTILVATFTSRSESWYSSPAMLYTPLPLLLWAALRFGRTGVNVGLLALTMLAVFGVVHDRGPFIGADPQHESALSIQAFLLLVAIPLQLLAKVIGERDRAEEKAYDRQRLLALTLKAARVGVWDMDLLSNQTSIDEQLATMFDLPAWERRDVSSWMMRMHPVDLAESEASMQEALATDAPRDESGDSLIGEAVCRVLHRDISWHWILSRGIVLRRPDGIPYRAMGIGIDVTESRRTAEAMRENEEQLELAAATADLGFWTLDVGTGEMWFSEHCAALLGVSNGATPARREIDLLLGRSTTVEERGEDEELTVARVLAHEFSITRGNGEERWLATTARRVRDEAANSERLIGVVRDITERRKQDEEVEERQQALAHLARVATMGELSTTIVHELGQPVGAVTLNAETARLLIERNRAWVGDASRFAVLQELIEDIVRDSRRAETVIGQLRRLMRREQRDREPVNIAIVVSEVLDLVRAELRKHDIAVEWEVSGEGLDVVVNRPQIHQVLLNIILNARDAMESVPPGARRLRVTLRREPFEEVVHVLIADSGMGIAADRLDEVFEPFVTSKAHGVGLGLAISRTIMADHGGDLRAESGEGGGAVLHLTLPVMSKVRAPNGVLADVSIRPNRPVSAGRTETDAGAAP